MPTKPADIAVVILNWNGKALLKEYLPSVTEHTPNATIYVADNNSTDASIAFVKATFPEVKIIALPKNYGFSKGYNEALKQIPGNYYVLLNSDVEVTKNWLSPLIDLLENNPQAVACQPKIKSWQDKSMFEYAGAAGGYIDQYGYPFCRGRIFDTIEEDTNQYNVNQEVFWASGACLCIRSEIFHKAGGLDEDFFAHMEEIDLCWRLKNKDYKIYCCGESQVYHLGGGSLHKSNPRKTYLNFRNVLCMLYKNLPQDKLVSTLFVKMILDEIAALRFFFTFSWGNTWAIVKAYWYFFTHLKQLKRKRNNNTTGLPQPILNKSIVKLYFLKGIRKFTDINF